MESTTAAVLRMEILILMKKVEHLEHQVDVLQEEINKMKEVLNNDHT